MIHTDWTFWHRVGRSVLNQEKGNRLAQEEKFASECNHMIERIVCCLSSNQHVRSLILIGSHARGDFGAHSDIDVVVITDTRMRRSTLYSLLPRKLNISRLSLLPHTCEAFQALYREGSLFLVHIMREGRVLYDDGYYSNLTRIPFRVSRESILLEWHILKLRFKSSENLSIYGELFAECLSRLYSMAKNIAIIALALKGVFVFNKDLAFRQFCMRFPDLEKDISGLLELEPFSTIWSKGLPAEQPFSPIGCRDSVEPYIHSLDKIIQRVELNE
jgi:predicted nucleotidyltransferase